MDINIYINRKKINPLCNNAIAEYVKRLSPYCKVNILPSPGRIKYSPGHSSAHYTINNSEDTISSEEFAKKINEVTSGGISKLNFFIGYPEEIISEIPDTNGFSVCTIQPSDEMSALLLSEQIYRAYTILNNITYHK